MSLAKPKARTLLMSLMLIVGVISAIGAMSQVKSQSVLAQMVGTWAMCTLDVSDCIKVKVISCKEDGDEAICRVTLP